MALKPNLAVASALVLPPLIAPKSGMIRSLFGEPNRGKLFGALCAGWCIIAVLLLVDRLPAAGESTISDEKQTSGTLECCKNVPSRAVMFAKANLDQKPAVTGPPGMVWVPGGDFTMGGVGSGVRPDELPRHRVRVDGFWMDQTEVTVTQFRRFVDATGYTTTAERKPDWEELKKQLPPGTKKPPESVLVAGSMVFVPTREPVSLDDWQQWWAWIPGANWRFPEGPDGAPASDDHPVTQVSWDDAAAYAKWANKRLPTEAEWERACRGNLEGKVYAWGDDEPSDENIRANIWYGDFPYAGKATDGFLLTAPVKSFPANGFDLYDMSGNVWEWCSDWYDTDQYTIDEKAAAGGLTVNPHGPASSHDPSTPFLPKRVTRGGSFLCNEQYCASYRPSARMSTSPDTSQNHLGFRCVTTPAQWDETRNAK